MRLPLFGRIAACLLLLALQGGACKNPTPPRRAPAPAPTDPKGDYFPPASSGSSFSLTGVTGVSLHEEYRIDVFVGRKNPDNGKDDFFNQAIPARLQERVTGLDAGILYYVWAQVKDSTETIVAESRVEKQSCKPQSFTATDSLVTLSLNVCPTEGGTTGNGDDSQLTIQPGTVDD